MDQERELILNAISAYWHIPVKYLVGVSANDLSEEDRSAWEEFYHAESKRVGKLFGGCADKISHAIVVSKRRASRANKPKARQ